VAPDAEAGMSCRMPAFLLGGRPLLGFRAAERHVSVFPFSPAAIEAVKDRLEGFDLAKGTGRFAPGVRCGLSLAMWRRSKTLPVGGISNGGCPALWSQDDP
jgi:uncharacterized protein YdhG (YjbR/CyaY superfamily)